MEVCDKLFGTTRLARQTAARQEAENAQMARKAVTIWREINGSATDDTPAGIFCVGLLLAKTLTPLSVQRATGLSKETVDALWAKAVAVGLIADGKVHCQWHDEESGALALILDAAVLRGDLERVDGDVSTKAE